jgi:hypothetical protein
MKTLLNQFVAVWACLLGITSSASAALTGYTDYAAYQLAASGTELIQNFDHLIGGDLITVIGDVSYETSGAGLHVYVTDGVVDDTVSPANYVGSSNLSFPRLSDEVITVNFGTPRSAVGIFVVHETESFSVASISALGSTQSQGAAHDTYEFGFLIPSMSSYFIGLVDPSGANSISSFTLTNSGQSQYYFDSQTSFVAVPEPHSAFALAGLAAMRIIRRRRA